MSNEIPLLNHQGIRPIPRNEVVAKMNHVRNMLTSCFNTYSSNVQSVVPDSELAEVPQLVFYYSKDSRRDNWRTRITNTFTCRAVNYNTEQEIFSFEHDGHQFSVKFLENSSVVAMQAYLESYGNVGEAYNLIGENIGLRVDPKGIFIPVMHNNEILDRETISGYVFDAATLLGMTNPSYNLTSLTFDQLKHQFVNGNYFSKELFEGDHTERRNRSTFFAKLQDWVRANNPPDRHSYASGKTPWVTYFKRNYKTALQTASEKYREVQKKIFLRDKLSDSLIQEVTGKTSEAEIKEFRNQLMTVIGKSTSYETFVLSSSPETIRAKVQEVHDSNPTIAATEVLNFSILEVIVPAGVEEGTFLGYGGYEVEVLGISLDAVDVSFRKTPKGYSEIVKNSARRLAKARRGYRLEENAKLWNIIRLPAPPAPPLETVTR